jgi:hypothetical protein
MVSQESSLLRLHVVVNDPEALIHVRFQTLNVLPPRVIAELAPSGMCHTQVVQSTSPVYPKTRSRG